MSLSAPLVVSDVKYTFVRVILSMGQSRGETGGPDPTGKSHFGTYICFLRNSGLDTSRKAI